MLKALVALALGCRMRGDGSLEGDLAPLALLQVLLLHFGQMAMEPCRLRGLEGLRVRRRRRYTEGSGLERRTREPFVECRQLERRLGKGPVEEFSELTDQRVQVIVVGGNAGYFGLDQQSLAFLGVERLRSLIGTLSALAATWDWRAARSWTGYWRWRSRASWL